MARIVAALNPQAWVENLANAIELANEAYEGWDPDEIPTSAIERQAIDRWISKISQFGEDTFLADDEPGYEDWCGRMVTAIDQIAELIRQGRAGLIYQCSIDLAVNELLGQRESFVLPAMAMAA